jgi:N-acetylmuramoyl-L-alanine amidase
MRRTALPRMLLATGIGLSLIALWLAAIGSPRPAVAHSDLTSSARSLPVQVAAPGVLCFVSDGATACVDRAGIEFAGALTDQVRSLMQMLVAGPTAAERARGVRSALPAGAALADVSASTGRAVIRFDLPSAFLASFDAGDAEDVNEQVATTLVPFNFARIDVETRDPSQPDGFRPLSSFLPPIAIPKKPGESDADPLHPSSFLPQPSSGQPPEYGHPQSQGGLAGKTVFVSAGHGWQWNSTQGQYRTQRPEYPNDPYPPGDGIVEDFNNAEIVNQYLLQYLWNAGADAWTVRERDMITAMHVVDNLSPTFSLEGAWGAGSSGGYNATYYSATTVTSGATATATWTFTPTKDAEYAVYVWFPNLGGSSARTPAARYLIDHAGGASAVTITQQRDGIDWRYVGSYPFRADAVGRVRLSNQSVVAGLNVLADAIRVGGGIGDFAPSGIPASLKPRWEEQALRYAQWVGLPDADTFNDVIVRPIFSEWEYESGEDAVYVSYHTNGYSGYNTTARGLETYIHNFEPTPKSDILQSYIHAELAGDIQAGWEPTWPDRGLKSKDLGELRLLDTMPGVLIENGFHDNPTDVDAEKDPRFNLLSARAIYQGLVRYWNSQDPNVPLEFLPEPPTHLRVRNTGPNQVTLDWRRGPTDALGLLGDAATWYHVYTSADGFGWREPISTTGASLTLSGLTPGQPIYVRVTGGNEGGESFPTPVLAARVAANGVAPVLVVYGFDRIDRLELIKQFDGAEGYNRRMFLDRINRYDYIIQHATGITYAFDSALHAAVTDGDVGLGNYPVVDWIAGEQQLSNPAPTPDPVLNATDQALLQTYLANGALLISGAEIGFDLVGNGAGPAFYSNTLRAVYVGDDANAYSVTPAAGGVFDGLGAIAFDDGTHGAYDVGFPDRIAPRAGASSALVYNVGVTAAVTYAGGPCSRLVYMAFPLETIYPQATRDALMSRALAFLDECVLPPINTAILSPSDGAAYNALPAFNGAAGGPNGVSAVQAAIVSGTQYFNGSTFGAAETWLTATGTLTWSYALPALADGDYQLKARAIEAGTISDTTPAVISFTLDTVSPTIPALITPTGGITAASAAPTFVWTGGGSPSGFDFELDGVAEVLSSPALSVTRSVTAGLHTWRVRAFDRAGNYSLWSAQATFIAPQIKVYLPLIAKDFAPVAPPAPTCYDAITNGGFESGLAGWTSLALNPPPAVVTQPVAGGAQSLRVGSAMTTTSLYTGFSSAQQSVSIPASALTATLEFQRYRISGDVVNDLQYVGVFSGTSLLDYLVYEKVNDPTWIGAQFDLLEYAGQSINLRFSVKNDGAGGATGLYVDGVSVQVCTP